MNCVFAQVTGVYIPSSPVPCALISLKWGDFVSDSLKASLPVVT